MVSRPTPARPTRERGILRSCVISRPGNDTDQAWATPKLQRSPAQHKTSENPSLTRRASENEAALAMIRALLAQKFNFKADASGSLSDSHVRAMNPVFVTTVRPLLLAVADAL